MFYYKILSTYYTNAYFAFILFIINSIIGVAHTSTHISQMNDLNNPS